MHQSPLVKDLRVALGGENVIFAPSELAVYDCDAFTLNRNPPQAVVFPQSTCQVAEVVKICNQHGMAIVPRGAGTGLAGGCLPAGRCIVLMLTRMNRVLEINLRDRWAVVEAGVYNSQLAKALAGTGYFFAAEPSTQGASSIGGNVATNASGANALKFGATVNHLLGLEAVLGDGSIVEFGPVADPASLDLVGLVAGGEGTLAVVTKVWLRLTPIPRNYRTMLAIFDSVEDAVNAVTQILAAGIVPSAIELMDHGILVAVNKSSETDIPADAGAMLLVELDGPEADLDRQQEQIVSLLKKNNATQARQASSPEDREILWKCRKSAITATGRLSPSYLIEDCVVPRTRLPQMLQKVAEIGQKNQVPIMNLAHAGDGNLHPIILYDERDQASVAQAMAASSELLQQCIALGGSVSGEHGVGTRKVDLMPRQFQSPDLEALNRVRYSFDPYGLLNPGKIMNSELLTLNPKPV
ncbi:MAG: FAD-linked oxidase C-terminal domain-containing protein [Thermoguttaceae bacterium]|jgi:glycolate oxidase